MQVPPCDIDNQPQENGITCERCIEHMVSPTGMQCVCAESYFMDVTLEVPKCVKCLDGMNCSDSGSTVADMALVRPR